MIRSSKSTTSSKLEAVDLSHPAVELEKLLTNYLPVIPLTSATQVVGRPCHDVGWVRARNFKRKTMSINLLEWSVEDAKRHPVLHKTVDNAVVEMVHLPDVFLQVRRFLIPHCLRVLI